MIETRTTSPDETISFAKSFAEKLKRGDVLALYGDLGSGKTQFVKGVCLSWKARTQATSPSFVILNRYDAKDSDGKEILLYHFDLYRIKSLTELYDLGYEEFVQSDGICLIEWAEMLQDLLPACRYDVCMSLGTEENERRIKIIKQGKP